MDFSLIDKWMTDLDQALMKGSTRERRDAAHAVYLQLRSVRDEQSAEANSAWLDRLETAIVKSRQLHDAFHAELQHELEWAEPHSAGID